jgi:hypothetical protein
MSCSAFDNAFENNENINLYIHSEKIHKWDQEKFHPFTINKLFPLQKSKSFLPYPFFIG